MHHLHEDHYTQITKHLDDSSIYNLFVASDEFAGVFASSSKLLREFVLHLDARNFQYIARYQKIRSTALKNISINFNYFITFDALIEFLNDYRQSLETLDLINLKAKDFKECLKFFSNFLNLKTLYLENCKIKLDVQSKLPSISSLTSITFNKCDANCLKIFSGQYSLQKVTIKNEDCTWNGFSHEDLNILIKNSPNLDHVVLIGDGTGSYFDSDEFPFKIRKLETTMITFNWYVGIKSARLNFLRPQTGSLKELTIHKLPYDFDGGKVLKYIIEEMALDKFYYGKIPLILNGKKQEVKRFSSNEIQIQSIYEMFRQYTSIETLELHLSATDIASDEVERIINTHTILFNNLVEFILVDNSAYRGVFGVFLDLYKNLRNIKKLTFRSLDRNINVILEECLPEMNNLEEICLTSTAPRVNERFQIISRFVPNLKRFTLASQFVGEAKEFFGIRVEIIGIN